MWSGGEKYNFSWKKYNFSQRNSRETFGGLEDTPERHIWCAQPPGHNYGFVVWVFGDFDFCGVFVGVLGYNETKVQLLLGVTFPLNSLLE